MSTKTYIIRNVAGIITKQMIFIAIVFDEKSFSDVILYGVEFVLPLFFIGISSSLLLSHKIDDKSKSKF
jgi:hypothetical protein